MKYVLITIFLFLLLILSFGKEYRLRQELNGYKYFVFKREPCIIDVDKNGVPNFDAFCLMKNDELIKKSIIFTITTSTPRK